MITPPPIALQSATRIIARTAAAFRVTVEDITGQGRQRHIVHARQAACWALRRCGARRGCSRPADTTAPPAAPHGSARPRRCCARSPGSASCWAARITPRSSITWPRPRPAAPPIPIGGRLLDALLADRAPPAVKFLAPARAAKPAARQIRHRNDFTLAAGDDPYLADTDAAKRQRGSIALAEALAAYQAERAA